VDAKIQCFAHRRPAYFKSSYELKKMLTIITLPPNMFLFTADVVSMYTNIPTAKALSFISNHIRETAHEFQDIPAEALIEALGIVMRNNVFTFGDVTYRQDRGTVMGTPPAPMWANLYMSINEDTFLQPFDINLTFYKKFIDDVLGLWTITNTATNAATWAAFGLHLNSELFELEWIIQPLSTQVDFMDMTISIEEDKIVTTLFEKPSNFHLYTPPNSFHPPGLLRGIVYRMMNSIHTLCSAHDDRKFRAITFFRHLQRRGYQPKDLYTLFNKAIISSREYVANHQAAPATQTDLRTIQFLHMEYHPRNPAASDLRSIWQNSVAAPPPRCHWQRSRT
jgi:hypothetical protein